MNPDAPLARRFGINWQLSASSGWGVLGWNFTIQAEKDGTFAGVPLRGIAHGDWLPPDYHSVRDSVIKRANQGLAPLGKSNRRQFNFPVLHALGNGLSSHDAAERFVGRRNLGVLFFDDTDIGSEALTLAGRFDVLLAGSTWNTDVLRRKNVRNVRTLLQGVDLSIFKPVYTTSAKRDPFVIFSGGKLEYRKGQDIVVEAFRRFRKRHPEAILLTVWHNHWPESIRGIDSKGYVAGLPELNASGDMEITPWLVRNGIPREALYNLSAVPNYTMSTVYAQADVALFPNRCEGGTNLVAMECMASGLPTILSANTGHLDLIDERHCYPLVRQAPAKPVASLVRGTEEWGESDIDEVVEKLEQVFIDSIDAGKRGTAAACFMKDWSWEKRFDELKECLKESEP